MRVLDLFSGIGGFSLGLERAGMRTVGFCEIDPRRRRVLARHWPDITCHEDIRTFFPAPGAADVVCGGFPCQDISYANPNGAGLAGERSGLWSELCRIIGVVRPDFAIVENVSALRDRGLGRVLGDLAEIGYDTEWHCIPASAVGAPHRRDRVWIVAHPPEVGPKDGCRVHTELHRFAKARQKVEGIGTGSGWTGGYWNPEPCLARLANGVPDQLDRIGDLGDSVVPQVVEVIGRAIMEAERERAAV